MATLGLVVGVAVVVWFFWPYVGRPELRRYWRSGAAAGWKHGRRRPVALVRRPGFTADLPPWIEPLPTFGRDTQAELRYTTEREAADAELLDEYALTIGHPLVLVPGGARILARRRAAARQRYAARADAAEQQYRPVHDVLAARDQEQRDKLERQRQEVEALRAEQNRLAHSLAEQANWAYDVSREAKRVVIRIRRTSDGRLTADALARELEPVWREAGMIDGPAIPGLGVKGYLLASTKGLGGPTTRLLWEDGVQESVRAATAGMPFTEWWLLATGYRLLDGYDLERHIEKKTRTHHFPYSTGYTTGF
ncbi:hypothetical protein AB0H36_35860 [Kribbella sp. NPDC050820]|uniref:hypothetical protein n=1 Tax=Kribbella sp. NPDC050820 TaxID=3155408 RepID=UPI0033FD5301